MSVVVNDSVRCPRRPGATCGVKVYDGNLNEGVDDGTAAYVSDLPGGLQSCTDVHSSLVLVLVLHVGVPTS